MYILILFRHFDIITNSNVLKVKTFSLALQSSVTECI